MWCSPDEIFLIFYFVGYHVDLYVSRIKGWTDRRSLLESNEADERQKSCADANWLDFLGNSSFLPRSACFRVFSNPVLGSVDIVDRFDGPQEVTQLLENK